MTSPILDSGSPHTAQEPLVQKPEYLKQLQSLQSIKKTRRENIMNQASFSKKAWDLVEKVMAGYSSNTSNGSKDHDEKEIKQYHLTPLHHLPVEFQA